MEGLIIISIITAFTGAIIAPVVHRFSEKFSPWILSVPSFISFLSILLLLPEVLKGSDIIFSYTWVEALGFHLQFRLDGLSLLFALLISGIGFLIVIYGGIYLAEDINLPKFYSYLFIFMGSMLGVVLSDNIFLLFVFWELTSFSSYLLIGYKHGIENARKSALQALIVTAFGGLSLLAGLLIASIISGSTQISIWEDGGAVFKESGYFGLMLGFIFIGAFSKSAQFPFHFWLPNAMAAPTPVSAYLHSATMVKAGVYLLARLNPYLSGTVEWHSTLIIIGGITALIGVVWALFQTDLKKILAYTTVSALGIMIFFIGLGTPKAIQAAIIFLLAHAFYKGGLFLIAGNIEFATGTRKVDKLSALFSKMKLTGVAAVLTTLSMAGFPFFLGFLSKELLYEAAMYAPRMNIIFTLVIFIPGVIFASLAYLLGWKIFFSKGNSSLPDGHYEEPAGMVFGPFLLGLCSLIAGFLPGITVEAILGNASYAVSSVAGELHLYLWHGFSPVLGLSVFTLLTGWLIYRISPAYKNFDRYLIRAERYGPEAIYEFSWKSILFFADILTRFIQSGYLRFYIMTVLVTLIGFILFPVFHYKLFDFSIYFNELKIYEIILALVVVTAIIFIVRANSRLAAIAILGVVGYGIAIFFAMYGAVDLAMTQFLIETLIVVVFVYILYKLPGYIKLSPGIYRYRDIVISIAGGATMSFVILLVTNYPMVSELKNFFAENSYILAKGRNIINVILVDFRALDTLGEITVLAVATLGVFALMKLRLSKSEK